jgi:hypothetical protein
MDSPGLTIYRQDSIALDTLPVRGVGWVLKWAGTIGVLLLSTTILASFAFQLAAERTLANAAAAGLREAALPRATSESVAAVVRQQLGSGGILVRATKLQLEQNGQPLRGVIRPKSGDQFAISLSVPARAIMPRWLPMHAWLSSGVVQWHAKQLAN